MSVHLLLENKARAQTVHILYVYKMYAFLIPEHSTTVLRVYLRRLVTTDSFEEQFLIYIYIKIILSDLMIKSEVVAGPA
jgi:hypothetical protein